MAANTNWKLRLCLLGDKVTFSLISDSKFTLHFPYDKEVRQTLPILAFENQHRILMECQSPQNVVTRNKVRDETDRDFIIGEHHEDWGQAKFLQDPAQAI